MLLRGDPKPDTPLDRSPIPNPQKLTALTNVIRRHEKPQRAGVTCYAALDN